MKLRNVAGLYVVRLRGRIGQELLALLGIAVGVSLLFAALVANTSLTGSFERLTDGVVGNARFQLSARGSTTIPEALLADVQRLPGVAEAAATLEIRGEATGSRGSDSLQLLGVTPELGRLGGSYTGNFSYGFLADVRAMALPTPLVESLGASLGQPLTLNLGGRDVQARLGAKLQRSDIGPALRSPVALAPLRYAQTLSGRPGQITRIMVVPQPGADAAVERRLRALAGGHADVLPADFDAALFRQASLPTNQSTAMFSVFGAMVGFLFAFSAMLLTVPQRRRLIADLDTEGYGTGTILKVLLFDALVLGTVASALGIVLGDQVARRLFDETPSFLQYAFTAAPERIVTLGNVLIAGAGGIIASCIAVLGPTATAVLKGRGPAERRERPRSARRIREAWLVAGGLACLGGAVAILAVAPASAAIGILGLGLLTTSMLLLLPLLLRLLVTAVDAATTRVRSVVPFLAIFDLRDPTTRARSLAVAMTGAVAVFSSVALQGAHADLLRGLDRTSRDVAALGDVWARAPGAANLLVTAPFPPPDVRPGPELERVDAFRGGLLDLGDRRVRVFGIPTSEMDLLAGIQLLDGDADEVNRRLREGGWIVLSAGVARDLGLEIGDRFTLPSPVPTRLRVAGLSTNFGWPPGAIVLNADDYARAWGNHDASALLATLAPGVSPAAGRRALRAAIGPRADLAVDTAAELDHDQRAASRSGVARLAQIAALVLVSAVIAMASAMAGLIWQRRSFLAGVKVEGYSTSELWRALLLQASVLIGAGCTIGAAFGLLGQSLLSRALTSVTGFPVVYSFAAVGALLTCLTVTVAAVIIVGLVGRRAAAVAPETGLAE